MHIDLYTGAIDWDRIYHTFHSPIQIAERIQEELGETKKQVVFSGFQETASVLANEMLVIFVDHASVVTDRAKDQYPKIKEVYTGDVTQLIASLPAPHVVIACRISAYWDAALYFQRLASALESFPREQVVIDFFDRDLVEPGQRLTFKSEAGTGDWVILDIEKPKGIEPSICKVKLNVSYSLGDQSFSYEGYRSFFKKDVLLRWAKSTLSNYNVTLRESLLHQDPSFSLKMARKNK